MAEKKTKKSDKEPQKKEVRKKEVQRSFCYA